MLNVQNPIIAQVSIKKHVSLSIQPERRSRCLMEALFLPLIPINVQQITISALRATRLHSFHPITLHPAHGPLQTSWLIDYYCVFIYPSKLKKKKKKRALMCGISPTMATLPACFNTIAFTGNPAGFHPRAAQEKGKNSCPLHHRGGL